MDPKPSPGDVRLAPAASGAAAMQLPSERDTPHVDERLVEPETRQEIVRGRRIHAAPANAEHGDEHTEVTTVVRLHAAPGYIVSTDLLTRAGPRSDFATDTCVRRSGINPDTGSRYLEELAFEVVNEQSDKYMLERAQDLTACGVRRLVAVFVKRGEICEWSAKDDRWLPLDLDSSLHDPTLIRPFPLRALFDAAAADDSLVDALAAKNNPRLAHRERLREQKGLERGLEQGLEQGLRKAVETLCRALEVPLGPDERAQMSDLDAVGLESLLSRIESERRWPSKR
ncbi:MAG: hypothetical protein AAGF11_53730 [Myxococcota bacterium]